MRPDGSATRRFSLRRLLLATFFIGLVTLVGLEIALSIRYRVSPPADHRLLDPALGNLHFYLPSETGVFYRVRRHYRQRFLRREFDTEIRTNDRGLREDFDVAGLRPDIAFAGDSFTFGWGVEAAQRYSAVVARAFPELSVVSLSYPNGHAPPFYLSYLQHHPELVPRTLVLGLFAFNDLSGDMRDAVLEVDPATGRILRAGSREYRVSPDGFLVQRAEPRPPPWSPARLLYATALGRTLRVLRPPTGASRERPPAPRGLDAGRLDETALEALGWVGALAELMTSGGGKLVVFYIPTAQTVGRYPAQCPYRRTGCRALRQENALGEALAGWFASREIAFIDPVPRFRALEHAGTRLYFPGDGHWSPAGHAAAGELVVARLGASRTP